MLVSPATSRRALSEEVQAANAWTSRHAWDLDVDLDQLLIRARCLHPVDGRDMFLKGVFDDYRLLPPIWLFTDEDGDPGSAGAWPSPGSVGDQSSIFHSVGVLCAHFSRRAYREFSGPHAGDWGGSERWLEVSQGIQATTLGDMLAVIDLNLAYSPGRMG